MKFTLYFLSAGFLFIQCSSKKLAQAQPGGKLLEMSKSPCFGRCPVYTLTIYQNGLMQLSAKDNFKFNGNYTRQMSKEALKSFSIKLNGLDIKNLNNEYRQPIADAPATTLIYYEGSNEKKIFTNFQYPDSLQRFTDELNKIVLDGAWDPVLDQRVSQEYIIQLGPDAKLSEILQRYQPYDMTLVKRLDPATHQYWVIAAKVIPGEADKLLAILKSDHSIQSAQTNKSLESR